MSVSNVTFATSAVVVRQRRCDMYIIDIPHEMKVMQVADIQVFIQLLTI